MEHSSMTYDLIISERFSGKRASNRPQQYKFHGQGCGLLPWLSGLGHSTKNNKRLFIKSLSLFKEDEPWTENWTLIDQSKSFSYFIFQSACVRPGLCLVLVSERGHELGRPLSRR